MFLPEKYLQINYKFCFVWNIEVIACSKYHLPNKNCINCNKLSNQLISKWCSEETNLLLNLLIDMNYLSCKSIMFETKRQVLWRLHNNLQSQNFKNGFNRHLVHPPWAKLLLVNRQMNKINDCKQNKKAQCIYNKTHT